MGSNATIVRLRGRSLDNLGEPTGTDTRTTLADCFVAPRSSTTIDDQGRGGAVVGLSLSGPYGTDLLHTDRVEVDGTVYDIEGEPGQWKHPTTTWEAGFEVALQRSQG